MSIQEAIIKIKHISETLADDPDKLEILDTETDYSKIIDWCLIKIREANYAQEMLGDLQAYYFNRKKAKESYVEKMRDVLVLLLESAGEVKHISAYGTLSLADKPHGVIITDESKLPEKFFKIEKKLDKAALNKAVIGGEIIDGAVLGNGGKTLRIN